MNEDVAYFRMPKVASTCLTEAIAGRCVVLGHGPGREKREGVARFKASHPTGFVFSFLRNPFDRLVSAYSYLRSSPLVYEEDLRDRREYVEPYRDFRDFVMRGVGDGLVTDQKHVRPQYLWVTDVEGRMLADWMGRYERLQEGFDEVCRRMGWEPTELPVKNKSCREKWWRFCYNVEMSVVVAKVYERDFEMGGYDRRMG